MFTNILLPIDLDFPPSWEKALPVVAGILGETGKLHILGIVHEIGSSVVATYLPSDFEARADDAMRTDLEAFVAAHVPAGIATEIHVGHGPVSEQIVETARVIGADLIAMVSHPPSELRMLLVGSQADRVVRHADRPVLVVR